MTPAGGCLRCALPTRPSPAGAPSAAPGWMRPARWSWDVLVDYLLGGVLHQRRQHGVVPPVYPACARIAVQDAGVMQASAAPMRADAGGRPGVKRPFAPPPRRRGRRSNNRRPTPIWINSFWMLCRRAIRCALIGIRPSRATRLRRCRPASRTATATAGLHIQLVREEPRAFDGFMAPLRQVFGRKELHRPWVGKKGLALEQTCGYWGQRGGVVRAQALGLNTCWVAMTICQGQRRLPAGCGAKNSAV